MALNPLPKSGQNLAQTRDGIRNNFTQFIDPGFSQNHVSFGTLGMGKHAFLQMPAQATTVTTPLATATNEAGLYAAVGIQSGVAELYFKRENLAAGVAGAPLTEFGTDTGILGTATTGFYYLPCGFLVKWGIVAAVNHQVITSALPFIVGPGDFTRIFDASIGAVQATAGGDNGLGVSIYALTTTTITIKNANNIYDAVPVYYAVTGFR